MKNKLFVALGMILVFGLLLTACDSNGEVSGSADSLKSMGPSSWAYVLGSSIDRSARNIIQGSDYELKIIVPRKGSSGFDEEKFIVTVTNIQNKRLTLVPKDQAAKDKFGNSFTVTLDVNGDMFQINGIKGSPPGLLVPIGNNTGTLDGAWFGWNGPNNTGDPNTLVINGNSVTNYLTMNTNDPSQEEWISVNQGSFSMTGNSLSVINWNIWDEADEMWYDLEDWVILKPGQGKPTVPVNITIINQTANQVTTNMDDVIQIWTRVPTN